MAGPHPKHATFTLPLDGVSADTLGVGTVLRALMTLHRACNQWHRCIREMETVVALEDPGASVHTTMELNEVVRKLALAYARLRTHVVPFDRMQFGDTIGSLRELALRGQVFVVVTSLHRLSRLVEVATDEAPSEDPECAVLADLLASIEDMTTFIGVEFPRITSLWEPLRRVCQQRDAPEPTSPELTRDESEGRAKLCRCAVQSAQHEMNALLGTKLGAFLQTGVENRQWPDVQAECSRMAIALQIYLSADPDLSLVEAEAKRCAAWARVDSRVVET